MLNKILFILLVVAAGTFVVWTGIFDTVLEKIGGSIAPTVTISPPPPPGRMASGQARPEETAPALNFQGVMRQGGEMMAIVNNDLYSVNDFINNSRVLRITDSYLIVQGRTREFRYNLASRY